MSGGNICRGETNELSSLSSVPGRVLYSFSFLVFSMSDCPFRKFHFSYGGKEVLVGIYRSAEGLKKIIAFNFRFPEDALLRAKLLKPGDPRDGEVVEIGPNMDVFQNIAEPFFEIEPPSERMLNGDVLLYS